MGIKANITTNKIEVAAAGRQGVKGATGDTGATGPQGPVGSLDDQLQVIYVSKVGNDSNSGLNIGLAKLTITAAITAASAMTPLVTNQIAIQIIDSGNYVESFSLPEWVHINGLNADVDGTIDLDDNCIIRLRRLANSGTGECISKINGAGLSKVQADIMFVSAAGNEGIAVKNGQLGCTIGTVIVDGGSAFLVRAGSRLVFDVQYMNLRNSGRGFLTSTTGGTGNVINGNILLVDDDGTGRFIRTVVDGDVLDIQGGSFLVNNLYDLGLNSILNLFAHITTGSRTADASAQINIVDTSGNSNLQGDLIVEGTLTNTAITANTAKISYTDAAAVALNTAKNTYPSADATKLLGIAALAQVNTIDSGDNVSLLVNDAGYISGSTSGITYVNSLSDLSSFLVSGTYELPPGHYRFNNDIDFGTADIKLMDLNGCYFFRGLCVSITLTYTGTSPFVTDDADGIILQWENMFVDTPNSAAFNLNNAGNSLIIELVVFLNTGAQSVVDGYDFFTTKYLISIGSVTGFLANDVGTISCQVPQYNNGQNIAGVYLTVSGAASQRLTVSDVDSRPESNEAMWDILANYGGLVSMTGGVHSTGVGDYFAATSRDHTDPDISVNNIKNVQSSRNVAFGFQTGNALVTTISTSGVPVKINAVWGDAILSRFTVNANGTWTYIGDENITVGASLICTVDAAGGGTKTMSAYLALNGTFLPTSKGENAGSSGIQISAAVLMALTTNDTIEAFVANDSDTSNLTVTTSTVNIGGG